MRTRVLSGLALAAVAALAGVSQAAVVINVDCQGYTWQHPAGLYSGVGVAPGSGTLWNQMDPVTGSITNITGSLNEATTVTVAITGAEGWGNTTYPNATPDQRALINDYMSVKQAVGSISLSGLTTGQGYDLYLFGQGDSAGQNTAFTLGGVTKKTVSPTFDGVLTENEEYVVFRNIQPDTNNKIIASFGVDLSEYAALNGFQLVTIPEPATLSLIGMGSAALLVGRRRRVA